MPLRPARGRWTVVLALTAVSAFWVLRVGVGSLEATTVVALDADALVRRADLIVHATCIDRQSFRDYRNLIVTRYTLQITETLKGTRLPDLVFEQPGGEVAGITTVIPGLSRYRVNDEMILFLGPTADAQSLGRLPVGLDQGIYRIARPKPQAPRRVSRNLADLHQVRTPGSRLNRAQFPEGVDLDKFKKAVRQRVARLADEEESR